jgi:transposase
MIPTHAELESELHQTKAELSQTKAELSQTKAELNQTRELLKRAIEEIHKLGDEVTKLKEQISKNSKNSSKPPSSDQKGNTDPNQLKKERKKRKGKARPPFPPERVDRHIQCSQENCPHCGSSAIQLNGQSPEILQQAELPEIKATVTEYQLLKYGCATCGKNSVAPLPTGVPDSAFGPKLMGLMVTLTGVFHLAKREAVQLIKELYGVDMGVGSVSNIEERVSEALDPIYQRIHGFIMESKLCKHFDETGWRDRGKRHYVWLASCELAAVYMIDRHRSSEAFLKLFTMNPDNVSAVTDRYAVYSIFKKHQYCLAHVIRDFHSYAERKGPDKQIGEAVESELKKVCHIHKRYREGKITLIERNRQIGRLKRKLECYLEDGMANGSDDLFKLSLTLLDNFDKLWTFTTIPGMEPTNNLAERDLRKLVIWRRKSYGTRSDRGKRFVERITTVAQTLKRQSQNILSFIQEAIIGFYNKATTPFISEALGF